MIRIACIVALSLALTANSPVSAADNPAAPPAASTTGGAGEKIAPYVARFGRQRPVVAVVGVNGGTVLPDYVIPYGILARSGVAEVLSVATQPGLLQLPPLQIKPDQTVAEFDVRYPDGADYVFVPAVDMTLRADAGLLAWIKAQAAKGATMISICNGSLVLANADLTSGHRATGHFSTYQARLEQYPQTHWMKNTRYVVDGKLVSSAGITAAIPTSLALVEAIAGAERAATVAASLGVRQWGTQHDSDAFRIKFGDYTAGIINTVFHGKQDVGVPVADGVDEIALALTAEAYSVTLRNRVHLLAGSDAPVRTRNGLVLVPDAVAGRGKPMDLVLPDWDATPAAQVIDKVIDDIVARYGASSGRFVALDMEYPWKGL
jgi:transcriptional regulator GlxA family with amidase domain